jgi:hypothetical protein
MIDLPRLVRLLCEHPELSAARIARKADCSSRTVVRYRKEVAYRDLPWSHYEPLSVEELDREFNKPRYRPPSKTPYDPDRVAAFLARPKATLRDAWEDYRASKPRPHVAYDTFRRRVGLTLPERTVRHRVRTGRHIFRYARHRAKRCRGAGFGPDSRGKVRLQGRGGRERSGRLDGQARACGIGGPCYW